MLVSMSKIKLLEEKCNTDLRTEGFPSQIKDYEPRKKGIEVVLGKFPVFTDILILFFSKTL